MISNRRKVESDRKNLKGHIVVPLWLTPQDIELWEESKRGVAVDRILAEVLADAGDEVNIEHIHTISRMYAPFVREWDLTFIYPGGEVRIENLETIYSFGMEIPSVIASFISDAVWEVVQALFLEVKSNDKSSDTGTEKEESPTTTE